MLSMQYEKFLISIKFSYFFVFFHKLSKNNKLFAKKKQKSNGLPVFYICLQHNS